MSTVPEAPTSTLLEVSDLRVSFRTESTPVRAVDGVSFTVRRGEVLAIVGESGAGKSVTAMTLMGLTRAPNTHIEGTAYLDSRRERNSQVEAAAHLNGRRELIGASEAELRGVRGAEIAMVFQDPISSLNPVHRVGDQIAEQIRAHERGVSRAQALERAVELMQRVGIPAARERVRSHPHELSGGMRQRVMIAMALSCEPSLLLADEPTTALDVTVQAQILEQLSELRAHTNAGIVLVTHDLGIVAEIADRILVMRAGKIVERGDVEEIFYEPKHPYTRTLLDSAGDEEGSREALHEGPSSRTPPAEVPVAHTDRSPATPLLEVERLTVHFHPKGRLLSGARVHALDGVSLSLAEGETLGVVGESGCGKTTLIRCLVRLVDPTDGAIRFRGTDVTRASSRELARLRRELGMVFQDPQASLNPRRRVSRILATGLRRRGVPRKETDMRARELLARVGLSGEHLRRFPHELSGGERQRVGIARALASEPRAIALDEPVSFLDASIRGQVLELLEGLKREFALSYVLVAHDLALVRRVSDRIAVMYLGKVVELARATELYERPAHPYTEALIAAIPIADPRASRARERRVIEGEPPSPLAPPPGCRFHPRCPYATDVCHTVEPPLIERADGRLLACHHPLDAG